jgi:hypothetical protein
MSTAFVRQLGSESGVQLNPLRDNSEIPTTDNSDQVFGIMMRATRGRIDNRSPLIAATCSRSWVAASRCACLR